MKLPVPKVFIPYPIVQIIEEIQDAKDNNLHEISYPLVKVDKHAFLQVKQTVYEHFHGMQIPSNLRAYIKISDYEDILNKVRQKVLDFIKQAQNNM